MPKDSVNSADPSGVLEDRPLHQSDQQAYEPSRPTQSTLTHILNNVGLGAINGADRCQNHWLLMPHRAFIGSWSMQALN